MQSRLRAGQQCTKANKLINLISGVYSTQWMVKSSLSRRFKFCWAAENGDLRLTADVKHCTVACDVSLTKQTNIKGPITRWELTHARASVRTQLIAIVAGAVERSVRVSTDLLAGARSQFTFVHVCSQKSEPVFWNYSLAILAPVGLKHCFVDP